MINVLDDKVQQFAKDVRGQKILTVMNKNRQLINALSTPLGKELLKDVIELANSSLEKFITMDIDKTNEKWLEAKAEYTSAQRLINRYMTKINQFHTDLERISK